MTVTSTHYNDIGLMELAQDAPRDTAIQFIRSRLQQDENYLYLTKDSPKKLRDEMERSPHNLTPLDHERLSRCDLAEDLLYRLHRLGLSEIETEAGVFTSWRLIAWVGGNRDIIQEAYFAAFKKLRTRSRLKTETLEVLLAWCRWEIGARRRYQQKFQARDSLHSLMSERPELIRSRYMRDIISEHFFPTAETHRVPKARKEWVLILASILVFKVIQDAGLENYRLAPNRQPVYLELLKPSGPDWTIDLKNLREEAIHLLPEYQTKDVISIFARWEQELTEAFNESFFTETDDLWHAREMAEDNQDTEREPGLRAEFAAEQLMDRVIRRARDGEIKELERVLLLAQQHTPVNRHEFVENFNRMLDALNLRIETEDGVHHRLAIKQGSSTRGTIQLSGKESKTRGFKRTGPLRIVRTATTYIGASTRPPKPGV